jgi:hypothetical protein
MLWVLQYMKTIFILRTGQRVAVDRFMAGPALTRGYWWWRTGHRTWSEVPA